MVNWWLAKGLAGFRIDAIINIKKDTAFPSFPPDGDDGLASCVKMVEEVQGCLLYTSMPVYLRACDIIYTKPGGLTSTEAAVTEIPIVHTKPIPGCETKNRSFFVKKGMSVTAYTEYGLVRKGMQLLHNPCLLYTSRCV